MRPIASAVRVESLDWPALVPAIHLFRSFRMAIQPGNLLLALLAVVMLYLGGAAMDLVWGGRVYDREFTTYQTRSPERFAQFLKLMQEADAELPVGSRPVRHGIFDTLVRQEAQAFQQLVVAATELNFGTAGLLSTGAESSALTRRPGVFGALWTMTLTIPGWLLKAHPGFFVTYLLYALALLVVFGGAICRLCALEATRQVRISSFAALRFSARRSGWLALAPLLPLGVALLIGLLLALAGFLTFNWPLLDIVGGLFFGLLLLGGFIMAVLLLGLAVSGGLLMPAVCAEGADAFDAVSRAYNYTLGRPWRFLFYSAVALVYGAITYLFVALLIFLALFLTRSALDVGVFRSLPAVTEAVTVGPDRLDAILPAPVFGRLMPEMNWEALKASRSATITAWLVVVWCKLLVALLPAFALSYFFATQTWIYLLLRRAADGTPLDVVYLEAGDLPEPVAGAPEKTEPAMTAAVKSTAEETPEIP